MGVDICLFHWIWIFMKPIIIYQTFNPKYCCSIHWKKFGKCARAVCRAPSKKQPFIWQKKSLRIPVFYEENNDFVIQHLLSNCFISRNIVILPALIIKTFLELFYIAASCKGKLGLFFVKTMTVVFFSSSLYFVRFFHKSLSKIKGIE